jgi:hypothetical protein
MQTQKTCCQVESISKTTPHGIFNRSWHTSRPAIYREFFENSCSMFKFPLSVWLFFCWLIQMPTITAFTKEADWKFENLQSSNQEWWQTLRIKTVPGVVYQLQKSSNLNSGNWVNIDTFYGTGAEWICPLFQGPASTTPTPASSVLPASPISSYPQISLTLEKSTIGETLISWTSLDDHTPHRQILSNVTLSPIWDSFESSYLNIHGSYYFAINPRLNSSVTFTSPTLATGLLDTAMISAFRAALPNITSNIEKNVIYAANYTAPPVSSGSQEFYRFSANWSFDSDHDSFFDWQEIIIDHNNPYTADSDGDGSQDQAAAAGSGINPDDFPTPGDVDEPTPQAMIQQIQIEAFRIEGFSNSTATSSPYVISGTDKTGDDMIFNNANSYESFHSQVQQLSLQLFGVSFSPFDFVQNLEKISLGNIRSAATSDGRYSTNYSSSHCLFRLLLDAPAPQGG